MPEDSDSIPFNLRKAEKYDQLVDYLVSKKEKLEQEGKTETLTYSLNLLDLAGAKAMSGNFDSHDDLEKALDFIENSDVNWDDYWIATLTCETDFLKSKSYELSKQVREHQKNYCLTKYGDKSEEYCKSLLNYTELLYLFIQDYDLAEANCRAGLSASYEIKNAEYDIYDMFVMYLMRIYDNREMAGDILTAEKIDLQTRQLERTEQKSDIHPDNYLYQLYNLGALYLIAKDYSNAIEYTSKGMEKAEELIGKDTDIYSAFVTNYYQAKSLSGDKDSVKELQLENLGRREKLLDKNSKYYFSELRNIASNYSELNHFDEAIRVISLTLEEIKEKEGETLNYANALNDLVSFKLSHQDYGDCIFLLNEIIDLKQKNNDYTYIGSRQTLSSLYQTLGDYLTAIEISENSLNDIAQLTKEGKNEDLISKMKQAIISSLSSNYSHLGNKQKSAFYQLELLRIIEKESGELVPENVVNELLAELEGRDYVYTDEDLEMLNKFNEETLELLEETGQLNSPEYSDYLSQLAAPYIIAGKFETALNYIEESLKSYEEQKNTQSIDYADCLELQAKTLQKLGNNESALASLKKSLKIKQTKLPETHPDILSLKSEIAGLGFREGDADAITFTKDVTKGLKKLLISSFAQLSSVERNIYWNKYKDWFQRDLYSIAFDVNDAELHEITLDGTLLSKGLLLNTDLEFYKLLTESNNTDLLNKYFKLCVIRSSLNNSTDMDPEEYQRQEIETQKLEKDLIENSKIYGDYAANLDVTWKQVKNKLEEGSIAIEFISFPDSKGNMLYAAYILRKDNDHPVYVKLFDEKDLKKIPTSSYYKDKTLSNLLWSKFDNYLQGIENIYFSPSGELYNIAIEYLPHYKDNGIISDNYNFYRLSSTRELAKGKATTVNHKAAIYGGMKYDTDAHFLAEDMARYPDLKTRELMWNFIDSLKFREGVSELPETMIEVDNINLSFQNSPVKAELFKGLDGTEASFKSLSGKNINIMHIATHGFYWTESEAKKAKDLVFLIKGDLNSPHLMEDKALTRTGLLFSGANNALSGKKIPEGVEDGILTAREISGLDFRGLDLIVMSACQTGLGEITGDGVFGLQRGFKKAGANTLLMSLWKVDDKATQILMTKFYEEFLSGKTKFEALKNARNYLRNYEEETEYDPADNLTASQRRRQEMQGEPQLVKQKVRAFQDPKYWAAFILLDAVN